MDQLAWHPVDRIPCAPPVHSKEDGRRRRTMRLGWLFVLFHNGKVYAYKDVPEPVFQAVRWADSVGSVFNRLVRTTYSYVNLGELKVVRRRKVTK